MFCIKCGFELPEGSNFCSRCGHNLSEVPSPSSPTAAIVADTRIRHGFVTFYLISAMICNFILSLVCVFNPYWLKQILIETSRATGDVRLLFITLSNIRFFAIAAIANTVGFTLLWYWKKIGFWIIIGSSVASLIFLVSKLRDTGQFFAGIVSMVIIWGILHIRKNSKNVWQQLRYR